MAHGMKINKFFYRYHTYACNSLYYIMHPSNLWEENQGHGTEFFFLKLSSLAKQIPYIVCKLTIHYHVHKSMQFVPLLSPINPVHTFPTDFFKAHHSIVLVSVPRSLEWSLTLISPPKPCMHLLSPLYAPCALFISIFLIWPPGLFGEGYRSWPLLWSFLHSLFPHPSQHPFLKILSLCSCLNMSY